MAKMTQMELEDLADAKVAVLKEFLNAQPPIDNGEAVLAIWDKLYDSTVQSVVVETVDGPSSEENPVFPYEQLEAIVGDGHNWKWPRMWQHMDEIERRGSAYRPGEKFNFDMPNKNENIMPMNICIAGGGPVGIRMAIEMKMAGHNVMQLEKRRESRVDSGEIDVLGFTNRINRPHMWPFVRNDLLKLNGKDFLQQKVQYPVFTEPDTSSIGIDELQCLLLKNALLLGVDFRLGCAYKNATVVKDPDTMMPSWDVEVVYDKEAAASYGCEPGKQVHNFDALIGCDGPRSTVRDTMTKYLGDIEKRKFMDCVGIVANVRKVSRKRLKELGFEYGQEPNDMNRTKMIFKDFFNKINTEAEGDLEALIYYKASFHNYTILTPKRANLVQHGLSGKVYHHTVARAALDGDPKAGEKAKLKAYCLRILKAAGIPVDEQLPNGGFVDPPNDVMAFDFAECWNTRKSISFELPPPGYSVAENGPYRGRNPHPIVALAGDSLLEPFWPMGLGLKRGWHAIYDTCWAVDNIFNPECSQRILKKEEVSWDEHYECMTEQIQKNLEYCKRLMVTDDLAKGAYNEKGPVILQLKKKYKDAETPTFQAEIDPWSRYKELEKEFADHAKYGLKGEAKDNWLHPVVVKTINKMKFYDDIRKKGKKDEFFHEGKKLLQIDGKEVEEKVEKAAASAAAAAPAKSPFAKAKPPGGFKRRPAPKPSEEKVVHKPAVAEVSEKAATKRASLVQTMLNGGLDALTEKKKPLGAKPAMPPNIMAEMGLHGPADDGHAASAEKMWDKMNGAHLTPAAEAELAHIRQMITSLTTSLDAYKKAEQDLLTKGKNDTKLPL